MTRGWVLSAVVMAGVASAQTTTVEPFRVRILTSGVEALQEHAINASNCSDTLVARWTYASISQPCGSLTVFSTEASSCPSQAAAGDVGLADVSLTTLLLTKTADINVKVAELPGFNTPTDGGTGITCGTTGINKYHRICASVQTGNGLQGCIGTLTYTSASPAIIKYDTYPPAAPVIVEARAQDSSVLLTFANEEDVATMEAEYRAQGDATFVSGGKVSDTEGFIRVSPLTNSTTYDLRLVAYDAAGNRSEPSDVISVTPVHMSGFFTVYREGGGAERGGCSTTAAGLALMALLGVGFIRRRRS